VLVFSLMHRSLQQYMRISVLQHAGCMIWTDRAMSPINPVSDNLR